MRNQEIDQLTLAELLERQVDDMRTAMRMLEAGPTPQHRRRWWQRQTD